MNQDDHPHRSINIVKKAKSVTPLTFMVTDHLRVGEMESPHSLPNPPWLLTQPPEQVAKYQHHK